MTQITLIRLGKSAFWRSALFTSLRAQRSNPSRGLRRRGLLRCARNDGWKRPSYARFADTMPHTAITAIRSEISTL